MDRRTFLGGVAMAGGASVLAREKRSLPMPGGSSTRIETAGIDDLRSGLESGRWTARGVSRSLLDRIRTMERSERTTRSVIVTNPDALSLAQERDRARHGGKARGVLDGIPILLKDNIDTGDRMATTAGSLALAGTPAPKDAFLVRRLREAGAVILGKTNLSEWANFRSTRPSSGWSAVGGQTRNPYALTRNTSGSSSGSAAAVAAGYAPVAIGTETDGSIVSPACHCSLVGLKPTLGLVSRTGIVPISHSQDTAGPMARTVRDAAILLGVLAGEDPTDAATEALGREGRWHADYTRFLDRDGLRGARLGVMRRAFGRNEKVNAVIERQLGVLRDLGAVLIDPVRVPTWDRFDEAEMVVLLHEFKSDIAAYLATRGEGFPMKSLADLIAFNERERLREMPYFGQERFLEAESCGPLTTPKYLEALEACRRLAWDQGILAVMDEHRLDALIGPTEQSPAWLIDLVRGDFYGGGCSSLPAVAGCPHLTIPAGYVSGLPVGLSFIGRRWSESDLLRLGYAYEQATRARRDPGFRQDAEFDA